MRLGSGDTLVHRMAADPLVAALLTLHDLHPVELPVRVGHALDTARRRLGSHGSGIALERVDTHTGTVHVTLAAGCGSSSETVRDVVRTAVAELAPEVAAVEFAAEAPGPALLQIGLRPPAPVGSRDRRGRVMTAGAGGRGPAAVPRPRDRRPRRRPCPPSAATCAPPRSPPSTRTSCTSWSAR